MVDFVQFLVLALTALLWWLARRDLTARASRLRASSSAEVDRLRDTVEALTEALEARVTTEEKRLSVLIAEARALQGPLVVHTPEAPSAETAESVETLVKTTSAPAAFEPAPVAASVVKVENAPESESEPSEASPEPEGAALDQHVLEAARRAALVRAQLATGLTDAIEIARRTGLPRGEVELLIGLRSLRIEPNTPIEVSLAAAEAPPPEPAPAPSETAEDDRYAAIYAMVASGVTNSTEIARRTGLGRGEVELILGLRARNVM